jgi:hypothetical protein
MSKFLEWGRILGLIGAVLWLLITAGFLQEFASDTIPDAAKSQGLTLPLAEPWILVNLQRMSLHLLDGEIKVKSYDIGRGAGPTGRIGVTGMGTPTGDFVISKKLRRENMLDRGSRFLMFEYPRAEDVERALEGGMIDSNDFDRLSEAIFAGREPPYDTPLGGPLGIQGNYFFFHSRNFTDGSVALANGDINELYNYVFPGMRVVIEAY